MAIALKSIAIIVNWQYFNFSLFKYTFSWQFSTVDWVMFNLLLFGALIAC
jgi:hypothetical protein